jgi:hypothetical protein
MVLIPSGSKTAFLEHKLPFLQNLSRDTIVYSGHGEESIGDALLTYNIPKEVRSRV